MAKEPERAIVDPQGGVSPDIQGKAIGVCYPCARVFDPHFHGEAACVGDLGCGDNALATAYTSRVGCRDTRAGGGEIHRADAGDIPGLPGCGAGGGDVRGIGGGGPPQQVRAVMASTTVIIDRDGDISGGGVEAVLQKALRCEWASHAEQQCQAGTWENRFHELWYVGCGMAPVLPDDNTGARTPDLIDFG